MGGQYGDDDDDLDAFIERVNRALERHFGPNHQDILSGGRIGAEFDWGEPKGTEAW